MGNTQYLGRGRVCSRLRSHSALSVPPSRPRSRRTRPALSHEAQRRLCRANMSAKRPDSIISIAPRHLSANSCVCNQRTADNYAPSCLVNSCCLVLSLLANDIGAAFRPNPNFVAHASGHIQTLTDTVCSLCCGISGIWIGNRQLAAQNEVSCEVGVVVRPVVGVSRCSVSFLDKAEWKTPAIQGRQRTVHPST